MRTILSFIQNNPHLIVVLNSEYKYVLYRLLSAILHISSSEWYKIGTKPKNWYRKYP